MVKVASSSHWGTESHSHPTRTAQHHQKYHHYGLGFELAGGMTDIENIGINLNLDWTMLTNIDFFGH